jgi:hypothetical protein
LVVSPTTIRDRMNIAVSYRTTGFSQSKIEGIMESFIGQLENLDSDAESTIPNKLSSRTPCAA